jgi:hypothetical protein
MPDISMCDGIGCDSKKKCWRFRAMANPYRQSYFAVAPGTNRGNCDYFWPIGGTANRKQPSGFRTVDVVVRTNPSKE